jgi:hypothetical protein
MRTAKPVLSLPADAIEEYLAGVSVKVCHLFSVAGAKRVAVPIRILHECGMEHKWREQRLLAHLSIRRAPCADGKSPDGTNGAHLCSEKQAEACTPKKTARDRTPPSSVIGSGLRSRFNIVYILNGMPTSSGLTDLKQVSSRL